MLGVCGIDPARISNYMSAKKLMRYILDFQYNPHPPRYSEWYKKHEGVCSNYGRPMGCMGDNPIYPTISLLIATALRWCVSIVAAVRPMKKKTPAGRTKTRKKKKKQKKSKKASSEPPQRCATAFAIRSCNINGGETKTRRKKKSKKFSSEPLQQCTTAFAVRCYDINTPCIVNARALCTQAPLTII